LSHRQPDELLPLTPLSHAVLLALADRDLHGYALVQEVVRQTSGALEPGTGTLYAALQRMQADGLIAGSDTLPGPGEDQRRKYYRITNYGRDVARAEIRRLARVLEVASETSLRAEPAAGKGA
jgi:DNA-binding PadR family transcriptional regulator